MDAEKTKENDSSLKAPLELCWPPLTKLLIKVSPKNEDLQCFSHYYQSQLREGRNKEEKKARKQNKMFYVLPLLPHL